MKWTKKVAYILVFLIIFSNLQIVSDAAIYSDVPSWATEAVDRVSEAGLLVGNSNGKFEPYEKVTYFKLVDVLTGMAGYKDPVFDQSITEDEKNYIENAYNVNEWIIDNYSKNESKWEHSQDNKIAYLLQKGIFNQGDISLFIKPDGTKGCVTKEALCKYIVRLLDMESDAFKGQGTTTFTDNNNINSMYKPFVALLQDLGIISGDTYDQFNPNQEVTRVILAVFINNVLDYQEEQSNFAPPVIDSELTEVVGKVAYITPNSGNKFIQIKLSETSSKYYKVSEDAEVYNGTTKLLDTLSNLVKVNDNIKALIDSDNIVQKIYLNPSVSDGNDTEPSVPSNNTDTNQTNPDLVNFEQITGIVENVASTLDGYKVTLKIQYVTWGNIEEVSKNYLLASNADITQNGKAIQAYEIEIGAMATVDVNNGVIYSADLKTSKHTIEGTVTGREIYEDKNILKIIDEDGTEREYNVTSDTVIHKQGIKTPLFKDIMIGNDITVEAEFENAIQLYCSSDYNTYEGYIEAIEISNDPKVTVRCEDNTVMQFNLGYDVDIIDDEEDEYINIYDLRLGYEIEIDVDSLEAYAIEVENKSSNNTFEGIISDIEEEGKEIIVKVKSDDIGGRYYLKTITMDSKTKVYRNGSYLSKNKLEEDMQVIITLDEDDNSEADTIHVIN